MDQLIWITPSIIIVAIIAVLSILRIRKSIKEKNNGTLKKNTSGNGELEALAISLAVAGIVFGTDRFISYSFFGASILLSIIALIKHKSFT